MMSGEKRLLNALKTWYQWQWQGPTMRSSIGFQLFLRSRLKAFRQTEDFKKKSRQNSINKLSDPKAGTVHTSGSISANQNARTMALRDKKMPTAAKLFQEMHSKKEETEKVFCDKRAKSGWDEYQRLKLNASQSVEQVNNDELFLQAAGGVNKPSTRGAGKISSRAKWCSSQLAEKHVRYIITVEKKKDAFESVVMEHLRMNGPYWGLTT